MIFVSHHAHVWVPTMRFVHGSQVWRCTICGDQAYDVHQTTVPWWQDDNLPAYCPGCGDPPSKHDGGYCATPESIDPS